MYELLCCLNADWLLKLGQREIGSAQVVEILLLPENISPNLRIKKLPTGNKLFPLLQWIALMFAQCCEHKIVVM